jgi:hypothetical protein
MMHSRNMTIKNDRKLSACGCVIGKLEDHWHIQNSDKSGSDAKKSNKVALAIEDSPLTSHAAQATTSASATNRQRTPSVIAAEVADSSGWLPSQKIVRQCKWSRRRLRRLRFYFSKWNIAFSFLVCDEVQRRSEEFNSL